MIYSNNRNGGYFNTVQHLRLGILGISEGNGHPYSWSAIFNGYNHEFMRDCPFPDIPVYLSKQRFPEDTIKEASVTHIWTQDREISENIAKASNIENVVDDFLELIGNVDAILLARDDAELHYEMSVPFLKAGLPIYIDKPMATSMDMAEKIYSLQQYDGQIFTCSALRYAKEFQLKDDEIEKIGLIKYIDACVVKSWDRYGVHIIEPVLKMIGDQGKITSIKNVGTEQRNIVTVNWEKGLQTTFSALGDALSPISIRIFGSNGFKELVFRDTFFAFKEALKTFVDVVFKRQKPPSREVVLDIVKIIEMGNRIE